QWLKIAYIQMCCIILSAALYAQLQAILKLQFIDKNSLISCINTYILAAYLGASFAWMIEVIQPGAFHINHPVTTHQLHDFVYFSFVTMATLGYGDITPVSEAAKISAVLISLFGQLYVAIFIAIILGKYLKQQTP
ncbi:MAG: two pore domain potassium channel family protein, partial [Bacteroidetes bacterium]